MLREAEAKRQLPGKRRAVTSMVASCSIRAADVRLESQKLPCVISSCARMDARVGVDRLMVEPTELLGIAGCPVIQALGHGAR